MLASSLVLVGLVGFVVLVYVVVVVGGGEAVGRTSSPLVSLSVLATALVALGFDPVQTRLEALASRVVAPEGQVSRTTRCGSWPRRSAAAMRRRSCPPHRPR